MDTGSVNYGLKGETGPMLRVLGFTLLICSILYPLVILGIARLWVPETAEGSIVRDMEGRIVGSRLLAQEFSRPGYFRPRPSATDYRGSGAAGSNLSPTNPEIRRRAEVLAAQFGAGPGHPLPAELATTSGSGLDPHLTLAAAAYQARRVASARGLSVQTVLDLLGSCTHRPGGPLGPGPLVNVLQVNMALDELGR